MPNAASLTWWCWVAAGRTWRLRAQRGFVFGGYSLGNADLLSTLGATEARRLYQLTVNAVDLIRTRARQYAIDCDLVDKGVILANWFNDPARLEKPRQLMKQAYGVEWECISAGELKEMLNTDRYYGGLLERNAFHFHPLKYVCGVARTITDLGARLFEHSPCSALKSAQASTWCAPQAVKCMQKKSCSQVAAMHEASIAPSNARYCRLPPTWLPPNPWGRD